MLANRLQYGAAIYIYKYGKKSKKEKGKQNLPSRYSLGEENI